MAVSYADIFTYDLLYKEYIQNKKSSLVIAREHNVQKPTILRYLKLHGLTQEQQRNDYEVSPLQYDMIIGNILGDGTFCTDGNDYRMSFRQAENQKDYLKFKFEIMKIFCKKKTVGISDGNKKYSKNEVAQLMYYFHTRALPLFNIYKKFNIIDALEKLNNNSFAIWLMDDGTFYNKNYQKYTPYYTLSIKRFSIEEAELAKEIIDRRFGVVANINYSKKDYYNNGNKYILNNLYFPTSETKKIQDLIINSDFGVSLLDTMKYKIICG